MLEKYVSHKLASSVFNVIQKMGSVSVAKALLIRVAMGTEEVAPHFEWQPGWNQELLWRGFLLTPYITMGISELIKKKKNFFFLKLVSLKTPKASCLFFKILSLFRAFPLCGKSTLSERRHPPESSLQSCLCCV